MTWDYWKFPRHPVAAEKFEMRGRNTIILYYHNSFDTELGDRVCANFRSRCACPACVAELDKFWFVTIPPSNQPRYAHVENCYINKTL